MAIILDILRPYISKNYLINNYTKKILNNESNPNSNSNPLLEAIYMGMRTLQN